MTQAGLRTRNKNGPTPGRVEPPYTTYFACHSIALESGDPFRDPFAGLSLLFTVLGAIRGPACY